MITSYCSLKRVDSLLLQITQFHAVASVWTGRCTLASLVLFWIWREKWLMPHVLLNCSSTSQNRNQTKDVNLQWAPQKDIQDQADEPATAAELWAQADTKRKAQVKNMSEPRLRDSSFYSCAYTLSGPPCRAKVLRMKYGKKQKTPGWFWKTISDYWSPGSDESEPLWKKSGSSLPNLKKKTYRNTTVT